MLLTLAFEHAIDGVASDCEIERIEAYVESRAGEVGPWIQDVRVATSADGFTFTPVEGVIAETAAVPEVVVDDAGNYHLFYVDGALDSVVPLARAGSTWMATHGIPGIGALRKRVSADGLTWVEDDGFEVTGVTRGMVVDPDVVRQPDGTWRMYYVGMTLPELLETMDWSYPEAHTVYWATSDDLVHWVQQGPAVTGPFADPSVLCREGDVCVMASFGLEWSRSTDGGVTFTHDGHWGVDGFAPEIVRMEDGSNRIFYNSMSVGAPLHSLHAADGTTFVAEEGERMPGTYGEAPTLARARPTGWFMWFHAFKDGSYPDPPTP